MACQHQGVATSLHVMGHSWCHVSESAMQCELVIFWRLLQFECDKHRRWQHLKQSCCTHARADTHAYRMHCCRRLHQFAESGAGGRAICRSTASGRSSALRMRP